MDTPGTPAVTDHPSLLTNQDAWWTAEADEVEGFDLLKGDALLDLVGVPFVAFKAVYREGTQRKDIPYRDDYVSLEVRIAPFPVLLRQLVRINTRRASQKPPAVELSLDDINRLAGEQVVGNDGSTGLYRQITQYLEAKELISLPDGERGNAEKGESVFDLPRSEWLTGAEAATEGIAIALKCSRGLRYSEYESEYLPAGKTARTWYIA